MSGVVESQASWLKNKTELLPDVNTLAMAAVPVGIFAVGCALALKPFARPTSKGMLRLCLTGPVDRLHTYGRTYNRHTKGKYVAVLGPQASGKTTTIEHAFGGRRGVHHYTVKLNTDDIDSLNMDNAVAGSLSFLPGSRQTTALTKLRRMDLLCRTVLRRPFVVVINLKSGGKGDLGPIVVGKLAGKVADFGREVCYDRHICPVVFETSVPQLGDEIVKRSAGCCKPIHILPMSLEGFLQTAAEYLAEEPDALKALGISVGKPPTKGWFEKDEDHHKRYTEWAKESILSKKANTGEEKKADTGEEIKDIITNYFFKVQPHVRKLSQMVEGRKPTEKVSKMIDSAHDELQQQLVLTPEEKVLVMKMVKAGPGGYLPCGTDFEAYTTLLSRPTSFTVARRIGGYITLHYVGHVYALLMQEHGNDDATVRALMKEYGWVTMAEEVPANTA